MRSDPGYIIENLFMIADKEGNDVPFVLNSVQDDLDQHLTQRSLVPKARQEGVTSYVLARYTALCLMKRNTRAVVISHDQESTQRMLRKVKYYLDEIRGPRAEISNMSANEVVFPKTNSMFYIGTAGSRKFGRGDTITNLHCSEYAFWPNPPELMRGLMQAVPRNGEIIVESTGNGLNDYYHRCMRSAKGAGRWSMHFYPWHTFNEYQIDLNEDEKEDWLDRLDESLEEVTLLEAGISLEQLVWRREKLEEMNFDLQSFKQEYPMTLDECFQMTGQSIFHKVTYKPTDDWKEVETGFWMLKDHPIVGYTYVIGADVAAGVGKDYSVAEVICVDTWEQVGEYVSNRIDPEAFGYKLGDVAGRFRDPYLVVEANNHGILTLAVLEKTYSPAMLHREVPVKGSEERQLMTLGYRQTSKTKPLVIGRLRAELANGLTIHSPILNSELSTYIEHENGQLGAQSGCNDDTVAGIACAVRGVNEAAAMSAARKHVAEAKPKADPFTLDGIIEEMGSRGRFPIAPQDEWVH